MSAINNIADLLEGLAAGKASGDKSFSQGTLAVLGFRIGNRPAETTGAVKDFTSHLQPAKARARTLDSTDSDPTGMKMDSAEARAYHPSLLPDTNSAPALKQSKTVVIKNTETKSLSPDRKSTPALELSNTVAIKSGADKPVRQGKESTLSRESGKIGAERKSSIGSKVAPGGHVTTRQVSTEGTTARVETSNAPLPPSAGNSGRAFLRPGKPQSNPTPVNFTKSDSRGDSPQSEPTDGRIINRQAAPLFRISDAPLQPLTERPTMIDHGGKESSAIPVISRQVKHPLNGTPSPANGSAATAAAESVRVHHITRQAFARVSTPRTTPVELSTVTAPALDIGNPPQRAVVMPETAEPTPLPVPQSAESPEVAPIGKNADRQPTKTAESDLEQKTQAATGTPENRVEKDRKRANPGTGRSGENSANSDSATANETLSEIGRPVVETQVKEPLKSPAHAKGTTSAYTGQSTLQTPVNPGNLAQSVRFSLAGGRRELTLQLKPEILGRALIMMRQEGDKLRLEFRLERPEARQAIEAQSAALREALVSAGFQNVTIEVRSDDNSTLWNEKAGEDRQQRDQNSDRDRTHEEEQNKPRSYRPRNFGYNTFEIAA